jgi:hypothetical protein
VSILTDEAVQQVRELVKRALLSGSYQTQALHRAMNEIAAIIGVDEDREQALDELEEHLAAWQAATQRFADAVLGSELLAGDEIDEYPKYLSDFAEFVVQVQRIKVKRS